MFLPPERLQTIGGPHSDRSTQFALTVFRPPASEWPAHPQGGTFAAYQLAFSTMPLA